MKRSKFLRLSKRDFFRGMIVAVLTATGTYLTVELQSGSAVDAEMFKRVGLSGLIALMAYLIKNLFTNTNDELLTTDKNI